jgi:menaquinone-dependent protoporphyrinogen oxidase
MIARPSPHPIVDVPVLYATTEGQTGRIADRLAARLQERGVNGRAIPIEAAEAIDWTRVRGVCLGASLHVEKHQPGAVAFARDHRAALDRVPSLFFSVSLAAASTNPAEAQAARALADEFVARTGWRPTRVASVAGRLAYTQYGFFVRWLMRRIAVKEGASGDTSRDHEYTDWAQVTRLADELVADIERAELAAIRSSA